MDIANRIQINRIRNTKIHSNVFLTYIGNKNTLVRVQGPDHLKVNQKNKRIKKTYPIFTLG